MSNNSEAVKRNRNKKKKLMIEAMGGKCLLCGFAESEALVFHHINPEEKSLAFSRIRSTNTNWDLIVKELKKCVLLCANCHNTAHAKGLEYYNFKSTFNDEYSSLRSKYIKPSSATSIVRHCIICGNILNTQQINCCSQECRISHQVKSTQKVNWGEEILNIISLREVDKLTYKEISNIYNVSDRTISDKYNKYIKEFAR